MKVKSIMTKPSGFTEHFAVVDPKGIREVLMQLPHPEDTHNDAIKSLVTAFNALLACLTTVDISDRLPSPDTDYLVRQFENEGFTVIKPIKK